MEMDIFGSGGDGDDSGVEERVLTGAAINQVLRFSNFLITVSTNVRPQNNEEGEALVMWLLDRTNEIFDDWSVLNGNCLKPAGTPNEDMETFPDGHRIISVKCKAAVEQSNNRQRGQIHAHWLVEVAHTYAQANEGNNGMQGVHVNVLALRNFLNGRIDLMNIENDRKPQKVYVNSRLLTRARDTQNKWLTLQYLNKTVDKAGTDLAAQREAASEDDRITAEGLEAVGEVIELDFSSTSTDEPPLAESPEPPLAPRMSRVTVAAPEMVRTTRAPAAPKMVRSTVAPPEFMEVSKLGIKKAAKGARKRY